MDEKCFSVYQFFPNGMCDCVAQNLDARTAVETAKSYTERPAVRIGVIARVIITDADDFCVFEWKNGEGVTFPTPQMRGTARP